MTPTVAEILDLPAMRAGAPQVVCAAGLSRPVRWVHSSDLLDLTNLLQGGELVLTTGAGLLATPRQYIEGLARAGAVGVVVELLQPTTMVPPAAVLAAEQMGMALVVLRQEVKFVQITEHAHRRIVAAQYQEVDFARRVHEKFTALTIQRANPAQIVTTAADLLDLPVVLEDLSHQAVAAATGEQHVDEVLADWERRSRVQAVGQQGEASDDGAPGGQQWLIQPVGRGEDAWARLIALPSQGNDASSAVQRQATMVLERAAQALTMHRMAERDEVSLVHQAQAGLIGDVLQERVRSEKEALARAQALGMRTGTTYVPAAIRVPGWVEEDPLAAQKRRTHLLTSLARTVRAEGHTGLFAARPDGAIAMVLQLSTGRRALDGAVDELGRALRRDAVHTLGVDGLVMGVAGAKGGVVAAVDELAAAAHIAAVAGTMASTDQVCFRISDIRLRGLVALLRDDPRVLRFAETELRELILDDLRSDMDNMGLLRTYLQAAGNKTLVARQLHMSRPALYARLARVEKVLGVNLDEGESRASLHFAMLTMEPWRAAGTSPARHYRP